MININNKTNIDSNKIMQVISLLPEEYTDMNVEVRIYGTRWSLLKTILNKKEQSIKFIDFLAILKVGIIGGYSGEETNKIELYLFNVPKSKVEYRVQNLVFTIFHELRHKYQNQYMRDFYNNEIKKCQGLSTMSKKIISKDLNLMIEKDADKFAYDFYIENQDKIDKIFEFDYEYDISP